MKVQKKHMELLVIGLASFFAGIAVSQLYNKLNSRLEQPQQTAVALNETQSERLLSHWNNNVTSTNESNVQEVDNVSVIDIPRSSIINFIVEIQQNGQPFDEICKELERLGIKATITNQARPLANSINVFCFRVPGRVDWADYKNSSEELNLKFPGKCIFLMYSNDEIVFGCENPSNSYFANGITSGYNSKRSKNFEHKILALKMSSRHYYKGDIYCHEEYIPIIGKNKETVRLIEEIASDIMPQ